MGGGLALEGKPRALGPQVGPGLRLDPADETRAFLHQAQLRGPDRGVRLPRLYRPPCGPLIF